MVIETPKMETMHATNLGGVERVSEELKER